MRLVARLCLSLLQTVRYYDEGASSPRPALPSAGASGETGDSEPSEASSGVRVSCRGQGSHTEEAAQPSLAHTAHCQ